MKILITGGAGFIGHHIAEFILTQTDHEIVFLDRLDVSGNLNRLAEIGVHDNYRHRCRIVFHNLRGEINQLLAKQIGPIDIILHLAAATHVDRSIESPMDFVQDNIVATTNLLEYARQLDSLKQFVYFGTDEVFGPAPEGVNYGEWSRYKSGNPYSATKAGAEELCLAYHNTYGLPIRITHCHDQDTKAWTPSGFVDEANIQVGDLVYALDEKGSLITTAVKSKVRYRYKGEMIKIETRKISQLITPEHRVMFSRSVGSPRRWQAYEYSKANELPKARLRLPVTGEWNGTEAQSLKLCADHGNGIPIPEISGQHLMELFGWFISEGSVSKGTISIAACSEEQKKKIYELITSFGFKARIDKEAVQFCCASLARYLGEQCGSGAHNKKIPDWVLNLSKDNLRTLLHSLIEGGGTDYGVRQSYYTASENLAWQVVDIAVKCGHSARAYKRKTKQPHNDKFTETWVVSIRRGVAHIEPSDISPVDYDGDVWCLETEAGNFFVERKGKISCSGNCMNVFGERQHPEKYIPMSTAKIHRGEKVIVHGNKEKTRAGSRFYIHARNVADAVFFVIKHGEDGEKYNIVGDREVDNLQLAKLIAEFQGRKLQYEMVDFHSSRPGHDLRYALDGGKLASMGWRPSNSFEDSLREVVLWTLANDHWII